VICTIYSHHTGFEKIRDLVQTVFPKANVSTSKQGEYDMLVSETKGGLFKPANFIQIVYRQRNEPSRQIPGTDDSPLTTNIRGMYGFVSSLPCRNEKVKELFLQKIPTLNSEFSIIQWRGKTSKLRSLIQTLANEFDAILFVQPGTLISRSDGQHFLDKNLNLILDQDGNCEIESLDVNIQSVYFDKEEVSLQQDQVARKSNSEKILTERNIKVNRHLPCIEAESETTLRQPEEVAQRVTILAITNLVAFNQITPGEGVDYLQRHDLWNFVTPDEADFLADPTQEKKNQVTWKCECIWTLMWALNKVDDLPFPDQLCDLSNIPPENYPVGKHKDPNDFINSATGIRSKKEILDANDLYYRLDWACVDARINGRQIAEVHPGVVYERHYALNWLVHYMDQDWDDVTCDT